MKALAVLAINQKVGVMEYKNSLAFKIWIVGILVMRAPVYFDSEPFGPFRNHGSNFAWILLKHSKSITW